MTNNRTRYVRRPLGDPPPPPPAPPLVALTNACPITGCPHGRDLLFHFHPEAPPALPPPNVSLIGTNYGDTFGQQDPDVIRPLPPVAGAILCALVAGAVGFVLGLATGWWTA